MTDMDIKVCVEEGQPGLITVELYVGPSHLFESGGDARILAADLRPSERWFLPPSGMAAYLEDVVVAPARRRRGVGGRLMDKFISIAREKGWERIGLIAQPGSDDSEFDIIGWYQRVGFVVDGPTEDGDTRMSLRL